MIYLPHSARAVPTRASQYEQTRKDDATYPDLVDCGGSRNLHSGRGSFQSCCDLTQHAQSAGKKTFYRRACQCDTTGDAPCMHYCSWQQLIPSVSLVSQPDKLCSGSACDSAHLASFYRTSIRQDSHTHSHGVCNVCSSRSTLRSM